MHWKNNLLCFIVTLILTSFKLCEGRADEEEESTAVEGVHRLSHVESGLRRPGSLQFKHEHLENFVPAVSQYKLAAKLKLMDPSVQCGNDLMTLTVKRTRAPHFLVDAGEEPLTPLSQMPSTCGFSVKRSRRDVQYAASYQGCHVSKEDNDYVLPLLFRGAPMTMSCPNMLTSPAVVCFPSKMVVKLGGVAAKDLKVKVSGAWQDLSTACSSCGVTFKELSGEVALIAPYNKHLCVEMKDGEYSLSLQWTDYELLTTCPPVPSTNPTTETTTPPSDANKVMQHPQFPYLQMISQNVQPQPTQSPAPRPPLPQFFVVAANSPEKQKAPEPQSSALSLMPQLPQFFVFPRPESLAEPSGNENTADKRVLLPRMPQSSQYQVPIFSEFPMVPGIFQPTTPSPLLATNTESSVATLATTTVIKEKPQFSVQAQFPVLRHPFPSFFKHPSPPNEQTQAVDDPQTGNQQLKPQPLHPQMFQLPMFYSSLNYPSQGQKSLILTPAPSTTSTSTDTAPPGNTFYQPHPYMPVYLVPEQAPMPVFLHPPVKPPTEPVPSEQREHKPVYQARQHFYHFLPEQRQMSPTGS